jgi:hypothetical protein
MKLEREMFEKILVVLKPAKGAVHVRDAKLFAGKDGTEFPPFVEDMRDKDGKPYGSASFLIYATDGGKTLPAETAIFPSLADWGAHSRCEHSACVTVHAGLDAVIDKPVEVLAVELEGKDGIRPKWEIWMIRDGTDFGFLHDSVARALSRPPDAEAQSG